MSYKNQQPAVSKPLIIALVVVAIIGVIVFARNMGGSEPEGKDAGGMDVPQSVKDLGPAAPQPGEPTPSDVGGR
jgi:hypothetical protein